MDGRIRLLCLGLVLCSCGRYQPQKEKAAKQPEPRETPHSLPLRVEPPPTPGPTEKWSRPPIRQPQLPERHPFLDKPGLDLPMLPQAPAWKGPFWDKRFQDWHYADLRYQAMPKLNWKLELEFARVPKKDVFSKFNVPVNNIDTVLDDIEREQQARKEGYPDFPIPLNVSVPY